MTAQPEIVVSPPLPHSFSFEQSVIGGLLFDAQSALAEVGDILSENDFYSPRNALLFRAIKKMADEGAAVDARLVSEWLTNRNLLDRAGGESYLGEVLKNSPATIVNIRVHAEKLRDYSVRRQLFAAGDQIGQTVLSRPDLDAVSILGEAEKLILSISANRDGIGKAMPIKTTTELLSDVYDAMEKSMLRQDGELSGLATGLGTLDHLLDGFQPKDMIIVGARPSMGKTALALNFAKAALLAQPLPVVFFSMEQSSMQLTQRLLAAISGVAYGKICRARDMSQDEWDSFNGASARLNGRNISVCNKGNLSPQEMQSVLRRVKREHGGVGMILTDYIQMMQIPGYPKNSRNNELCEVSQALKGMAVDYDCPHIVLSQLSKECERRPDKRPMLGDLRDCGGIEQDADIAILLYRREYYFPDDQDALGKAELIIAKNRNGERKTVITNFQGSIFKFSDMTYGGYQYD